MTSGDRPSPPRRRRRPGSTAWATALLAWAAAGARGLDAAPPAFTQHPGMSSASAAVAVGTDHFLAASDEDNRLRLYPLTNGPAVMAFDAGPFLKLAHRHGEVDLEGAATVGDRTYWLGSHGRGKDGRARPDRQRLFATQLVTNLQGVSFRWVGRPYRHLLDDLESAPQLERFHLAEAARHAPEDGGINLEGLAAAPGGELLIGFRSPVPDGQALLVPLQNPAEVVDGRRARLGQPLLLDLDRLGIRDLAWSGREWFCIAGRPGSGGNARLYHWKPGEARAVRIDHTGFRQANPEALAVFGTPESPRLLVLSDDDKRTQAQFRSFWVTP